jgi:hypothetical protein
MKVAVGAALAPLFTAQAQQLTRPAHCLEAAVQAFINRCRE